MRRRFSDDGAVFHGAMRSPATAAVAEPPSQKRRRMRDRLSTAMH